MLAPPRSSWLAAREGEPIILSSKARARAGRSITQGFFPLQGTGQRFFLNCDRFRARILDLVGLGRVELNIFREFWRNIRIRIDGVHWAHFYTCHAINAVLRVNDDLAVQFVEARDRADLHAVGELASVTFLGDNVGHGISIIESCVKKIAVTSNWRPIASKMHALFSVCSNQTKS